MIRSYFAGRQALRCPDCNSTSFEPTGQDGVPGAAVFWCYVRCALCGLAFRFASRHPAQQRGAHYDTTA